MSYNTIVEQLEAFEATLKGCRDLDRRCSLMKQAVELVAQIESPVMVASWLGRLEMADPDMTVIKERLDRGQTLTGIANELGRDLSYLDQLVRQDPILSGLAKRNKQRRRDELARSSMATIDVRLLEAKLREGKTVAVIARETGYHKHTLRRRLRYCPDLEDLARKNYQVWNMGRTKGFDWDLVRRRLEEGESVFTISKDLGWTLPQKIQKHPDLLEIARRNSIPNKINWDVGRVAEMLKAGAIPKEIALAFGHGKGAVQSMLDQHPDLKQVAVANLRRYQSRKKTEWASQPGNRVKLSEHQRAVWERPGFRQGVRDREKSLDEATKNRISEVQQAIWRNNPERRQRQADRMKRLWADAEYKQHAIESMKNSLARPEVRKLLSDVTRERMVKFWSENDFADWISRFSPEKQEEIIRAIGWNKAQREVRSKIVPLGAPREAKS